METRTNTTTHRHSCNYTSGFPVGPPSDCFLATDLFSIDLHAKKLATTCMAGRFKSKTQKLRTKSAWFARSKKENFGLESQGQRSWGKQLGFLLKPGATLVFRYFSCFFQMASGFFPNMPVVFGFSSWNFDVLGVCCSPSQYSHYSHEAPTQSLTSHGANMCKWCDRLR